jgi:hypothetical protein
MTGAHKCGPTTYELQAVSLMLNICMGKKGRAHLKYRIKSGDTMKIPGLFKLNVIDNFLNNMENSNII